MLLIVLRHLIWPQPSLAERVLRLARLYFSGLGTSASWVIALSSRIIILAAGFVVVSNLPPDARRYPFRVSHDEWLNLPARFDAGWYLGIARNGYGEWRSELSGHRHPWAFFPAYPAMMRVAGDLVTVPAKLARDATLFGNGDSRVLWGGVLVSVICFGFAAANVHRLAFHEYGELDASLRAVILLASYPFSLFFSVAYSEGLFLLALTFTLIAWKNRSARLACLSGMVVGLTRSNGWAVSLALAVDTLTDRTRRPCLQSWLTALTPALGALLYSGYVLAATGGALEWVRAQEGWGGRIEPLAFLTRRWDAVTATGFLNYIVADAVDAMTFCAVLLAVGCALVWSARRNWLYAALIVVYLMPAILIDLPASGRMTSVLFPVFLLLAQCTRGTRFVLLVATFAAGQLYLASQFFSWRPPF
jgi:hypothetical protein